MADEGMSLLCACVSEGKCILGFSWHRHSHTYTHHRMKTVNNVLSISLSSQTAQAIRRPTSKTSEHLPSSSGREQIILNQPVLWKNKGARISWQKGQTEVELQFGRKSIRCFLSVTVLMIELNNWSLQTLLVAYEPD